MTRDDNRNYIQEVLARLTTELPDLDFDPALADLYAQLVLTTGENTTLRNVHDAWAIWRNRTKPWSEFLVPFDQLNNETQELDRRYRDAIARVAHALRTEITRCVITQLRQSAIIL